MRKLSEYKNEEALDLLAEIIEPTAIILADKEFLNSLKINKMEAIKYIIKSHKKEVIEVLAALEGVPVKDYECTILTLPATLMQIVNDPELLDFFKSQGLEINNESSGSATLITGEEV